MGEPDFYTVEEAADRLRIGRTAAYLAAKEYRLTGGADGLPVIAVRGSLRVHRRKLEEWAGGRLGEPDAPAAETSRTTPRPTRRTKSTRPKLTGQGSLPFSD
jgi:hypothetical protein